MRRILYVDPAPFAGGAQQSLAVLVRFLDRGRFEPLLAGPALLDEILPGVRRFPLEIPPLRGRRGAAAFLFGSAASGIRLAGIVRRVRPAVVHANGRGAWLPSWIACHLTGVPLLWHGRDLVGPRFFDRAAALSSTACIVPSDALRRRLAGDEGLFLRHKIRVIPNGVDTDRFRPGDRMICREQADLPQHRIIVGMIGQWAPWKRVDLFLEAARRAASQDPRLFFVLCGAPPPGQGDALAGDYARALSTTGTVLPWTRDVPGLLGALDVLVHPSSEEAFGRVLVEAMACGVPVIAPRGGGAAETVIDGETGILVESGSPEGLGRAIVGLAGDEGLRRSMGECGRRRVLKHYSAPVHASLVQQEYERLAVCP